MSQIVSLDPELVFDLDRAPKDAIAAIDQLYSGYYKDVRRFERNMRDMHRNYLSIISPVAAEICRRSAQGRMVIGEDFLQGFHARSAHIADEATRIRISFERQHKAALDLASLVKFD